jgi:hypothetical protein
MPTYPFLSDEWMQEVSRIREEHAEAVSPPSYSVRMNQVITEVPFGTGTIDAYMDTSTGTLAMGLGHLSNPEVTITLDYETAKAILVERNPQAGMQAFLDGRLKVQGDMTKLIAMQQASPDPATAEIHQKIKEVTA